MVRRWRFEVSGWAARVLVCVAAVVVASCSSSSTTTNTSTGPTTAATTTFQGTVAGSGGQSGTITLTVQSQVALSPRHLRLPFVATLHAQASVAASGSVHIAGGSTTTLAGTFDPSTKAFNVSGGGFAFTGVLGGTVVSGTYTGPSGVTGGFSSLSTTTGTVTAYCGNVFSSGAGQVATGVFNLAVSQATGAVSGTFSITADTPPTVGSITGRLTGTAITFTFTGTAGQSAGQSGTGTGTIQGGTVSGRSDSNNPFSGSTSACQ